MAEPARSGCPINAAVEAFGDSWSLLVLRDVMFGNRRYFRELLAGSEEGIASNILADRLKRLVSAGLSTREDAGPGRRAAYSLTEASIQLVPVFAQLGEWGLHHRPTTKRLRVRADEFEHRFATLLLRRRRIFAYSIQVFVDVLRNRFEKQFARAARILQQEKFQHFNRRIARPLIHRHAARPTDFETLRPSSSRNISNGNPSGACAPITRRICPDRRAESVRSLPYNS